MKELLKAVDDLPWILKVILCIPALDIVWAVYRIVDGVVHNKLANIVLGIVWIVGACTVTWVVDLIFMIVYHRVPKF